jgi:hypothetical protein
VPTSIPKTTQPVSEPLSLSPFPPHYPLYNSNTTIFSAEPPHHTIVLAIGLGATAPSDWTRAQKILLVGFFYLIATLLWGLTFWSFICA